ncbi:hypothetical protein BDZ88DRAFT_403253 [Geranomyces variabilis]|nr:hypothetical protein BDZ88DRAFT_403253 [Geranomyces variabilis]
MSGAPITSNPLLPSQPDYQPQSPPPARTPGRSHGRSHSRSHSHSHSRPHGRSQSRSHGRDRSYRYPITPPFNTETLPPYHAADNRAGPEMPFSTGTLPPPYALPPPPPPVLPPATNTFRPPVASASILLLATVLHLGIIAIAVALSLSVAQNQGVHSVKFVVTLCCILAAIALPLLCMVAYYGRGVLIKTGLEASLRWGWIGMKWSPPSPPASPGSSARGYSTSSDSYGSTQACGSWCCSDCFIGGSGSACEGAVLIFIGIMVLGCLAFVLLSYGQIVLWRTCWLLADRICTDKRVRVELPVHV